jgi:hypothetical protein
MVATFIVGAFVKAGAQAFAHITGSLVDHKALRGVQEKAESGEDMRVVNSTLILSSKELEKLNKNRNWALGHLRADALKRAEGEANE